MSSLTGRSVAGGCKVNRSGGWGSGDSAYQFSQVSLESQCPRL